MLGISLNLAPQTGYLLAYFRDTLVFEPYSIEDGHLMFPGWEAYEEMMPAECHLFDENTEYRMIAREARRDQVEVILSRQQEEEMAPELIYEEASLVQEKYIRMGRLPEQLRIINRYRFTDDDTLVLQNYRISI